MTNSFWLILYAILGIFAWIGIYGLVDIFLQNFQLDKKHKLIFYIILTVGSLGILFSANELKEV